MISRIIILAIVLACALSLPGAETALALPGTTDFDKALKPFLAENCFGCHDARKQKGDFRLDTLPVDFTTDAVAQRWAEVMFRLNAGEMPPKKEPQPSPEALGRAVGWIS